MTAGVDGERVTLLVPDLSGVVVTVGPGARLRPSPLAERRLAAPGGVVGLRPALHLH